MDLTTLAALVRDMRKIQRTVEKAYAQKQPVHASLIAERIYSEMAVDKAVAAIPQTLNND